MYREPLCLPPGVARQRGGVQRHLSRRYPAFFAHMGSCAGPNPSHALGSPRNAGPCRLLRTPAGRWPFLTLSLRVFPRMPGPLPRRPERVHLPISSPPGGGLPQCPSGSACRQIPLRDFRAGKCYRGFSHSLMFRPPGLPATQVPPTAAAQGPQGSRSVYVRAEHTSLPSCVSDMLAACTGNWRRRDLHPARLAALSAAPGQRSFFILTSSLGPPIFGAWFGSHAWSVPTRRITSRSAACGA